MSELEKAQLQPIGADGSPMGDAIPVQFNPSTLRLQISNQVEGGATRGRQVRQYTGSSSTTLTVELIFDTADEGSTDAPVSVRTKTMQVEQFVYPQGDGAQKQAPPKLRFEWGDLVLEGVVESLNLDLDHFAENGVPLRAKVGFSFKEQDRRYELRTLGAGANDQGGAPSPGEAAGGAPGSSGSDAASRVARAIGGESAAEFAARLGLDAAAWRGLSFGASLGGSLSLDAGLEIGFSAGLSVSAGVGVFVGASAGASVSLEASFGLDVSVGVTAVANVGADVELQQGFSLAAAGGVTAALESVKIARAEAASTQTKAAFGMTTASGSTNAVAGTGGSAASGAAPAPVRPALPDQSRTPMRLAAGTAPSNSGGGGGGAAAVPAPAPPSVDSRAASFGFGVPLRPVVSAGGGVQEAASIQGTSAVARGFGGEVPSTADPTVPPWVALPASGSGAGGKARATASPRRRPPCGCGGA